MGKKKKKTKRVNGQAKGGTGERALSDYIDSQGFATRRNQQYCGKAEGDPDVYVLDRTSQLCRFHIESKYTGSLSLYPAMAQAIHDASKKGTIPTVFHKRISRKDRGKEWLTILRAEDFLKLIKEIESLKNPNNPDQQETVVVQPKVAEVNVADEKESVLRDHPEDLAVPEKPSKD